MQTKKTIIILSLFLLFLSGGMAGADNLALDLSPARWIWYPSGRTLQNTFVLFRKQFTLNEQPQKAVGWILADSRYRLFINGKRVQWGPAPSDPRWQEADPLDIASFLTKGRNTIAVEVCYFGTGDGTYTIGKPGLIVNLNVDGTSIVTDDSWLCNLAQSWKPGKYKRWLLRALQEDFDARLYPYGWENNEFQTDKDWLKASVISKSGAYPSACNIYAEYLTSINGDKSTFQIRRRSVPMMKETYVPVSRLAESMQIHWKRPVEEYFDMTIPDAYDVTAKSIVTKEDTDWIVSPKGQDAAALTFEFDEQGVGWPCFTIDAPEGTIVELLVHEAHQIGQSPIINTHFNAWSRFVCKEGVNHFETFDFESFKWLQLHIRNFNRPVKISSVCMRRRIYPWKTIPIIKLSNDTIQKVMEANINTLYNCEQETMVDGMARERQQYSGDGGHQLQASLQAFGVSELSRRYINTFSQGSSIEGYFMDSWPGWDRLMRIYERQLQMTGWGPILDHSIGFCFDCYNYYMQSGDKEGLQEVYPRLIKFFHYMKSLTAEDNMVPSDSVGICSVWIDHNAFKSQRDKKLALNLYIVAMCRNALAPLCRLFDDKAETKEIEDYAERMYSACINNYWDKQQHIFVNNLPWIKTDGAARYDDRSLATALIFDLCPNDSYQKSLDILIKCPKELGLSYPCNSVWRQWALIKYKQINIVLSDLIGKWGNMSSVWENNTIQEGWDSKPDETSQWSHCAVAPLIALYQGIAGIAPLKPGSEEIKIFPQLANLSSADFDVQTLKGPVHFTAKQVRGKRHLELTIPENQTAELWLDSKETIHLPFIRTEKNGLKVYKLSGGQKYSLNLKYL